MPVEIKGAEQLAALSKRLKEMADKDLQRELSKGINQAVKPLRKELKESARTSLPRKGGLNERVARARVNTRKSQRGIRLTAGGARSQVDEINAGRFRHPVFLTHRSRGGAWVEQSVTPGWWDRPTEAAGDEIRRELEAAINRIAKKVERG